jgi:hypothetical protein
MTSGVVVSMSNHVPGTAGDCGRPQTLQRALPFPPWRMSEPWLDARPFRLVILRTRGAEKKILSNDLKTGGMPFRFRAQN